MHVRICSPLIIAASTTALIPSTTLAKADLPSSTTGHELASLISNQSQRADSNDDRNQTSTQAIHRLVKKMLTRRNTIDICDKGTRRCK